MSRSDRLLVTLPSDIMNYIDTQSRAKRIPIATLARSLIVAGIASEQLLTEKPKPPVEKISPFLKNKPITVVSSNTDITQVERERRFWKLRNEETMDALKRDWPMPTYDDNTHGRVWVQTGSASWEGEWITEAEAKRQEEENDAMEEEQPT